MGAGFGMVSLIDVPLSNDIDPLIVRENYQSFINSLRFVNRQNEMNLSKVNPLLLIIGTILIIPFCVVSYHTWFDPLV
jgi:hypothetical protein